MQGGPGEHHLLAMLLLCQHDIEAVVAQAWRRLLGASVASDQTGELADLLAHQRGQVSVARAQHQLVLHLLLVVELLLQLQETRVLEPLLHLSGPWLLLLLALLQEVLVPLARPS